MPSPLSLSLVVAQFALIASLLSPLAGLVPRHVADLPGALLLLASLVLAVWAFVSMRRRTFTVLPEPRAASELVTRGPYAFVRHPMYAAVLLGGLGAFLLRPTVVDAVLSVLLIGVMVVKLHYEERLLAAHHPGYADYRRRTAALVPGLY